MSGESGDRVERVVIEWGVSGESGDRVGSEWRGW